MGVQWRVACSKGGAMNTSFSPRTFVFAACAALVTTVGCGGGGSGSGSGSGSGAGSGGSGGGSALSSGMRWPSSRSMACSSERSSGSQNEMA